MGIDARKPNFVACKPQRCMPACAISQSGFVCSFDLILYIPSTIIQLNRDRSSRVEPVLS